MVTQEMLLPFRGKLQTRIPRVHEIKAPTCEMYEPNFLKVFELAQDPLNIDENGDIVNHTGAIVASMWSNKEIFGFKHWLRNVPSNASRGTILVKNPTKLGEEISQVGIRNGLYVIEETAFAVRITSGGYYVTRTVIPEYQSWFVEQYYHLVRQFSDF